MANRNYYEVLGVDRGADADTIKKAYRKLAMEHHPDRNPGNPEAEQNFKNLNQAYDILKDPQKKTAYDRFGHEAFEQAMAGGSGSGGGGGGGGRGGFEFNFGAGFSDIFDQMFGEFMGDGGGRRRSTARRGSDLKYNLEISLEDAFAGKQVQIRVPTAETCGDCAGVGAEKGSKPISCPSCNGVGRVRAQQGFFTVERTCPSCGGAGQVIEKACKSCGGAGRVRKEKTLSVIIPEGVEEGTRIRLSGEGEAGMNDAPAGDLYIFIAVAPHNLFLRDGPNILCKVPIPMTTASLGGEIEVPVVDGGRAKLSIPEGTQSGQRFRLRAKGMTVLRGRQRGDMFIETAVEIPKNLTKRQKEILKAFEAEGDGRNSPDSEGFFAKVRELWEDLNG